MRVRTGERERRTIRGAQRLLAGVVGAVLVAGLYLLFWPIDARLERWTPPSPPERAGPFEPNRRLAAVERIPLGGAPGPEDVAVDRFGRIYTGTEDGRILRIDPRRGEEEPETFARTGGRPMGLAFGPDGDLAVADLRRGLLSVDRGGEVRTLVRTAGGRPLGRTNGVAVGNDGSIYFTDASWAHPDGPAAPALIEHRPTGRLLRHDPDGERTEVLLDSLYFPNGVAVGPDGSYLLVVETGAYRVRRVELTGHPPLPSRVVSENLPGFPDGVTADPDGRFWLTLAAPRSRVLDALMPHPFPRAALLRIPAVVRPGPRRFGFVLALDDEGRILETLQDPSGRYAPITSATPVKDLLYLGSDREDALGRIARPRGPAPEEDGGGGVSEGVRLVTRTAGAGARPAPEAGRRPEASSRSTGVFPPRGGPDWRKGPTREEVVGQELPFDTLAFSKGGFAEMRTRIEKTIFGIDVLSLRLRVDEGTATRLAGAAKAEAGGKEEAISDSVVAAVLEAPEIWAVVDIHRSFGRDQMIEGTLRNISGAVEAGWLDLAPGSDFRRGLVRSLLEP